MQKMIGTLPRELRRKSSDAKYKQLFHHPDGTLLLKDSRRSRSQAKRLDLYFRLADKMEHRHLYDLVSKCLQWRANDRIHAYQFFKHSYFQFIQKKLTHNHTFHKLNDHRTCAGKNTANNSLISSSSSSSNSSVNNVNIVDISNSGAINNNTHTGIAFS